MSQMSVLIIGIDPGLIDFTQPAWRAFPNITAEKIRADLAASAAQLRALGYDSDLCPTDFGETAESVVAARLASRAYDCVLIGAGIRLVPDHTELFEKLVNAVHAGAPQAKLCFNTRPDDTVDAVRRWV